MRCSVDGPTTRRHPDHRRSGSWPPAASNRAVGTTVGARRGVADTDLESQPSSRSCGAPPASRWHRRRPGPSRDRGRLGTDHGPTPVRSPYDAALEAMLPSSLRDVPLTRYSVPITRSRPAATCVRSSARRAGAAVCRIGVDAAAIVFGVAYADRSSDLKAAIMALRFRRSRPPSWSTSGSRSGSVGTTTDLPTDARDLTVGSRAVTWATYPPFYEDDHGE